MKARTSRMIELKHVVLASPEQMEFVIEGMRNPMNSWDRIDSGIMGDPFGEGRRDTFSLGKKDLSLMQDLCRAGTDHRKFLRMLPVYVRITAPLYWWKEFDTYKVGTVANSCSTMHKIHENEFVTNDFSTEHLTTGSLRALKDTIDILNDAREWYLKWDYMNEKDRENFDQNIHEKKDLWWQMIQLLPSSYNQTRNIMLNYEVLANIYHSRKNHKLDEWRQFCNWTKSLPYFEELFIDHVEGEESA